MAEVPDDVYGNIAGETLEGACFAVSITNTLHVLLQLFEIIG